MTSTDHTAPDPRLDPSTPITEYPESDELRRELDEHGVLLLTFDRPERNNGWTHTLEDAYLQHLHPSCKNYTKKKRPPQGDTGEREAHARLLFLFFLSYL